ncbi:ATP-binding cassette domain-containing protein [Clavibacter sp. Sh2088]|uniref:ATP-binding cassette domain-containing protein n=1 Tax=Clavibacter sp. Sh2088 TaxID=3397676 RepID=UPI0039E0EC47
MTDAPDETTSPDATSATGAQPQDGASTGASSPADEAAGATASSPAAVPGPPRPGQRVPRRATAPSPRTAPAVVVAPTPPRVRSTPLVAPSPRPADAGAAAEEGTSTSTPARPPRVRRRTRVQRAAGGADVAAGPAVEEQPAGEQTSPDVSADEPVAPTEGAADADAVSHEPTAEPEADGVEDVRSLFDDAGPELDSEPTAEAPQDAPETGTADAAPDVDADVDVDAAEPQDRPSAVSEPASEPAEDAIVEATVIEAEAEAEAEPERETQVDPEPTPEPSPARAVTVRTDSLTSPRPSRPGLAGVGETALTPSVRGERAAAPELGDAVLVIEGLTKRFDEKVAVDDIALTVRAGSFYGIVGPNGAGKTTTMSMVTGLLRPDAGTVTVNGIDVWRDPLTAKRSIGVLPDRLRLFDRLTGAQLLHYSGALRGLDDAEIRSRSADLIQAFGLEDAVGRLVTDYSAGMTKKVALACAMIHSPRMLVLDEPFESVDPVSAANVVEILQDYVAHGGTVVLSSHGMDFIQRICDHVAIIVNGRVLASGTMDEVRAGRSLEERFVALAGGRRTAEGFSWLHSFSD